MVPTVTLAVAIVRIQRRHVIERRENVPPVRQDGKEKNVILVSKRSGGLILYIKSIFELKGPMNLKCFSNSPDLNDSEELKQNAVNPIKKFQWCQKLFKF